MSGPFFGRHGTPICSGKIFKLSVIQNETKDSFYRFRIMWSTGAARCEEYCGVFYKTERVISYFYEMKKAIFFPLSRLATLEHHLQLLERLG